METLHYGYGLPPDFSAHGSAIDQLIYVLHGFMLLLFVGWGLFLLYCMIRFRRREGRQASYESTQSRLPKYAELAVILFEAFLLVGISLPIWSKYKRAFPEEKDALVVQVVAQQFVWNIHYPGEDKKFGRSNPKFVSDSNPLGIDAEDPASWDDFVSVNQFHMPVHQAVITHITSSDVIHSFGIPVLRVKQDATPGLTSPIWFEATRTGSFEIVCSQLCGVGHFLMKGLVIVESPEDFNKWFQKQKRPFRPSAAAASFKNKNES